MYWHLNMCQSTAPRFFLKPPVKRTLLGEQCGGLYRLSSADLCNIRPVLPHCPAGWGVPCPVLLLLWKVLRSQYFPECTNASCQCHASALLDLHRHQSAKIEDKLPAAPVNSLDPQNGSVWPVNTFRADPVALCATVYTCAAAVGFGAFRCKIFLQLALDISIQLSIGTSPALDVSLPLAWMLQPCQMAVRARGEGPELALLMCLLISLLTVRGSSTEHTHPEISRFIFEVLVACGLVSGLCKHLKCSHFTCHKN